MYNQEKLKKKIRNTLRESLADVNRNYSIHTVYTRCRILKIIYPVVCWNKQNNMMIDHIRIFYPPSLLQIILKNNIGIYYLNLSTFNMINLFWYIHAFKKNQVWYISIQYTVTIICIVNISPLYHFRIKLVPLWFFFIMQSLLSTNSLNGLFY